MSQTRTLLDVAFFSLYALSLVGNNLVLIHSFLWVTGFKHHSKFFNPCKCSNSRKSLFALEVQTHVTVLMKKCENSINAVFLSEFLINLLNLVVFFFKSSLS